jgi:hypothetical protein
MAIKIQLTVECGRCPAVWPPDARPIAILPSDKTLREGGTTMILAARRAAQLDGWVSVDGVDLCPECGERQLRITN